MLDNYIYVVRCRGASGVSLKIQQEKLVGNFEGWSCFVVLAGGEEHNMFNVSASFSTVKKTSSGRE